MYLYVGFIRANYVLCLWFYNGGFRISQTGGRQPKKGAANLLFGQISPKSCMKMKEIGPRGASKILLCRSATGLWGKFLKEGTQTQR